MIPLCLMHHQTNARSHVERDSTAQNSAFPSPRHSRADHLSFFFSSLIDAQLIIVDNVGISCHFRGPPAISHQSFSALDSRPGQQYSHWQGHSVAGGVHVTRLYWCIMLLFTHANVMGPPCSFNEQTRIMLSFRLNLGERNDQQRHGRARNHHISLRLCQDALHANRNVAIKQTPPANRISKAQFPAQYNAAVLTNPK